ncbi:MAG: peptide-methionine (R)-S-oxide reductase MsrB [SAR324 cluster bacterium]|nr:peptide-methionine (R)-S-oxide reductase MsrB [SAR324 cluster bacterium]MBL7034981.1 peptide-methionine (R)-S-oxide reductase MsrB [SAR324 cluster bacterium]
MADKTTLSEEDWQERLTPEQFEICRKKGTERPFSGDYVETKNKGTYHCSCCGNELFKSEEKFDSGSGWPSFWDSIGEDKVRTQEDHSLFRQRTEVLCSQCDAHLGHVFEDGPLPTGLRYCINSVSLVFEEDKES